jgi:hypothetical protein
MPIGHDHVMGLFGPGHCQACARGTGRLAG